MNHSFGSFILITLSLLSSPSLAFIWTQALPQDKKPLLRIENPTNEAISYWIQHRGTNLFTETPIFLKPKSQERFEFSHWNPEHLAFSIKSFSKELKVFLEFPDWGTVPLSSDQSTRWRWKHQNTKVQRLFVLNLAAETQTLTLTTALGKVHKLETQKYYDTTEWAVPFEGSFEISGPGRFKVLALTDEGPKELQGVWTRPQAQDLPTEGRFFLASTESLQESFLLHLTDEVVIQQAQQALKSSSAKILIADIGASTSNWNRPFTGVKSAPWSWSVQKVHGFSDLAHIDCDGFASLVEERLNSWLGFGRICFWKTHLWKELTRDEVISGELTLPPPSLPLVHEFPRPSPAPF